MWEKILNAIKQLSLLTHQVEENRIAIKEMRQQMQGFSLSLERLAYEFARLSDKVEHNRQRETQEREKFILRLENEMLKFERRLPPAPPETGRRKK